MRPSDFVRKLENRILGWLRPDAEEDVYQRRIDELRRRGVRIGAGCWIHTSEFSTEPYLIEIGNRVGIAAGTKFVTHEGSAGMLRRQIKNIQVFGCIRVGDDTIIGIDCIILPGTTIGSRCVVGAGAVVKGNIPDGAVVVGNPARVLKTTAELAASLESNPHRLDIWNLEPREREARLKAHFGIDTPPAEIETRVDRPRRRLR